MALDERKPVKPHQLSNETYDGRLRLQCCSDCSTHMLYGQEICSYCLSEHTEWVRQTDKVTATLAG